MLRIMKDYIQKVQNKFKVQVSAVVTDSASNMVRMEELASVEFPNVFFLPCMAHWLNLVAKIQESLMVSNNPANDIVGESTVMAKVVETLKGFSRNHAPRFPPLFSLVLPEKIWPQHMGCCE